MREGKENITSFHRREGNSPRRRGNGLPRKIDQFNLGKGRLEGSNKRSHSGFADIFRENRGEVQKK